MIGRVIMNIEEAKKILKDDIQPDGGLYNLGHYMAWSPGDSNICLDCRFDSRELEAIVVYINHQNASRESGGSDG